MKLSINDSLCIGCNKCVLSCPAGLYKPDANGGKPRLEMKPICIECLHCAGACPANAIVLEDNDSLRSQEVFASNEEFYGDLEKFLRSRRSYRNFTGEKPDKNILAHVLNEVLWAPSAKNEHPTQWVVVSDPKMYESIMDIVLNFVRTSGKCPEIDRMYKIGKNMVLGTSNTVVVGHANPNMNNPLADTAIAIYHAEILLQAKGLGTCWSGYLTTMCNEIDELKEMLGIPAEHRVYGSFMVGNIEQEKYVHTPNRVCDHQISWIWN